VLLCAGSIGVFSLYRRQMLFVQQKSRVSTLEHVVLTETVFEGVVPRFILHKKNSPRVRVYFRERFR
jgi:hypothetical protein